jgi:ABC-2 type transport system permease protein
MRRTIHVALTYLRVGALNELQYRLNFFLQLFQSLIALAGGLFGLAIVFQHTDALAGWSQPELLIVMGVHLLIGGLILAVVQPNMLRLAEDIQQGTLDYVLTRPVDAQVLASLREFRPWQLVDVLIGLVLIIVGAQRAALLPDALQLAIFVGVLICGALMLYAFWLMLSSVAFWVVRIDNMLNLFEGIYAAGRWPVDIYPGWLRGLLTFIVPVAFAVTVPAGVLLERLQPGTLLLSLALTVGLLAAARLVWRVALRQYSGASA